MTKLERARVRVGLWVVGCVSAAALIIGTIYGVASIHSLVEATRQTQIANVERDKADRARDEATAATAANAALAAERIEECTTPGQKCFEEQVSRTGEAVAGINQGTLAVIVSAISCQEDGIEEPVELARCTAKRAARSTVRSNAAQPQE